MIGITFLFSLLTVNHSAKLHLQIYQDMEKLVCDKRLLNDLDYLGLFKHTGKLKESYVYGNTTFQFSLCNYNLFFPYLHYLMCMWCTFYVHTGALEVFHNSLLRYMPKRLHFSYPGMQERGMLAIMEHNENIVKRTQATTAAGYSNMFLNIFLHVTCRSSLSTPLTVL